LDGVFTRRRAHYPRPSVEAVSQESPCPIIIPLFGSITRRRRRGNSPRRKNPAKFFEEVAQALTGTHEILIIGPAQTKQEFANFLKEKHSPLGKGIVAVETADHPSDAEVLSHARRHFKALDRMFTPDGAPASSA